MTTKAALAAIVFTTLFATIVGLRFLARESIPEMSVTTNRQSSQATSNTQSPEYDPKASTLLDSLPGDPEYPDVPSVSSESLPVAEAPAPDPGPTYAEALEAIASFVEEFSEAHNTRDADFLIATLNPAAVAAYGAEACNAYVTATAGSINSIELLAMGAAITYSYAANSATTEIAGAWPVQLSVLVKGEPQILSGHFMYDGGDVSWLTRCDQ
jgi:hypothetical protein